MVVSIQTGSYHLDEDLLSGRFHLIYLVAKELKLPSDCQALLLFRY